MAPGVTLAASGIQEGEQLSFNRTLSLSGAAQLAAFMGRIFLEKTHSGIPCSKIFAA
jgi:hypothetical protein